MNSVYATREVALASVPAVNAAISSADVITAMMPTDEIGELDAPIKPAM